MGKRPEDAKTIHVVSSGLKAGATWHRVEILQACRECCGGQGFLAANKIGPMKNDMDVDVTFEGDNTVMMQQVCLLRCHIMPHSSSADTAVCEPIMTEIKSIGPPIVWCLCQVVGSFLGSQVPE